MSAVDFVLLGLNVLQTVALVVLFMMRYRTIRMTDRMVRSQRQQLEILRNVERHQRERHLLQVDGITMMKEILELQHSRSIAGIDLADQLSELSVSVDRLTMEFRQAGEPQELP